MNGIGLYQQTAVTTQSKEKLLVMLYDGAIKFLKTALIDIQKQNYESKNRNIQKANGIILELNTVLDVQSGGDVAQNLRNLYNFMYSHLIKANIKNDTNMIRDVIKLLEELNQGWKAICE